jgi:allantoinase
MSGRPPFDYNPLPRRPRLEWPGGARLAVWVGVNVEHWPYGQPGLSIGPSTAHLVPDPMNYGWRDYGSRVGIFRMLEVFGDLGIPVTGMLQSDVCELYPDVVAAATEQGWAWIAHGRNSGVMQANLDPDTERADLLHQVTTIERETGQRPRGWLGPALTESERTPQILADLDFTHVVDWCNDDQPYRLRDGGGKVVSVPYSVEINDITVLVHRGISGSEYRQLLIDQFEGLYAAADATGLAMAIPLHTFLVGQPFRLGYLREALEHIVSREDVWMTTSDAIADHYLANH